MRYADIETVTLSSRQLDHAYKWAEDRQASVKARNGQSQGHSNFPLRQDIIGVMGELAFAQWSGLPWTAVRGFGYDKRSGDVGKIEVRTRRHETDRDLFVKRSKFKTQTPSTIYVLTWATENYDVVDVIGWTTLGRIATFGYDRFADCIGYRWNDLETPARLRDIIGIKEPE